MTILPYFGMRSPSPRKLSRNRNARVSCKAVSRETIEHRKMQHISIGIPLALTVAVINPVRAQAPLPTWPPAYSAGASQAYPFAALPPWDAYRQGFINRWELEQLQGPIPQALQGPTPNGRGGSGGGSN